jgi:integrase
MDQGQRPAQGETRYLKRQRADGGWYFVLAIPKTLRGTFISQGKKAENGRRRPGKPLSKIIVSLGTQSLAEARQTRWPLVTEWKSRFERAEAKVSLTLAEIEEQAREVYSSTLERMEDDAKRGILITGQPQRDESPEVAGLALHAWTYEEALEDGNFDLVAGELAAVQRRKGVEVKPETETYRLMAKAILVAKIAALGGRIRALKGEPSEPPLTFLGTKGIDPVTLKPVVAMPRPKVRQRSNGDPPFSEIASLFIDELQHDKGAALTEQTRGQYEAVFRLFAQYAKDAPLNAIDRALAADFLSTIATLHPHWGRAPKAKELPLDKLLEKFGGGEQHLTNKTLNRYASALSAVFKWSRKRGKFDGTNPFVEQTRTKAAKGTTEWLPYTADELTKLFKAPLFTAPAAERLRPIKHNVETAMRWVPLIALYSGMRLGEICQLRTGDVKHAGKIWFFNVAEEGEGQSVKTSSAIRRVPVHSMLIRCGLLDYLDALSDGQLFPGLKPGGPDKKLSWYFTRRYTEFRRSVRIKRPRLSFHSYRKNFVTALDRARIPQADIAGLIGHERGFTLDVYAPLGLDLAALRRIMEKVRYPSLRLAHLYARS